MREPLHEVQNVFDRSALDQTATTLQDRESPHDSGFELLAGECFASYKLLSKIGSGGMGVVYLAEDRELRRRVAIKLLPKHILTDSERVRRFQQEAHVASQLNHPNILTVHCVGQTEKLYYIVTELIEGETLRQRSLKNRFSIAETLEITIQIALALQAAHKNGVIHRDIKPENVMMRADGLVKVLDFGLAKLVDAAQINDLNNANVETSAGMLIGTPAYLSPEQIENKKLDARTDLFALGAVLYECLTGNTAFSAATVPETLARIINLELPPPSTLNPQVPADLDRATLKLLKKNPAERFQTANELIIELRRIQTQLSNYEEATTATFAKRFKRAPTTSFARFAAAFARKPLRAAAFAIALLAFAAAIWFLPVLPAFFARAPKPAAVNSFEIGTAALRDGAYFKAGKMFEDAVAADPDFALAHARLAEAWSELDYTARAANAMLQAQKLQREQSNLLSNQFAASENRLFDAIDAMVRRDFGEAARLYRQIAVASPEKAFCFVDLGRALEKNEDLKAAIQAYEAAIKLDNQLAAAHLRLGVLRNRSGDFERAFADFDRAEQLYDRAANDEGVAETGFERGKAFNLQDNHDRARREFELVLANPRASRHQQIKAMLQISSLCSGAGNVSCAKDFANRAISFARAERMENLATVGLIDLGNAYLARGELAEAEKQFEQALNLARSDGGQRNAARALIMLGSLRVEQNRVAEAKGFVVQALPFFEQSGSRREVSISQVLLGIVSERQNDFAAALRFYEQAEQSDNAAQRALAQDATGNILLQLERFPEAIARIEQSLDFHEKTANQASAAYNSLTLAEIESRLGRIERAKERLAASEKTIRETDGVKAYLADEAAFVNARIALAESNAALALKQVEPFLVLDEPLVAAEANRLTCAAKMRLGARLQTSAIEHCRAALTVAERENRRISVNAARLTLAEAELNAKQFDSAQQTAKQVVNDCRALDQHESTWRAAAIAALAARSRNDVAVAREHASQSLKSLDELKNLWNAETFDAYIKTADAANRLMQVQAILKL